MKKVRIGRVEAWVPHNDYSLELGADLIFTRNLAHLTISIQLWSHELRIGMPMPKFLRRDTSRDRVR